MAFSIIKSNNFDTYLLSLDVCVCVCFLWACFWCAVECNIMWILPLHSEHTFFHTHKSDHIHIQKQEYWAFYLDVLNITPTSIPTVPIQFSILNLYEKCPLLLYLEMLSISLMYKFRWWADGQTDMHGRQGVRIFHANKCVRFEYYSSWSLQLLHNNDVRE